MFVRHLAERDRHVAGEACFRGQDVVVGVVEPPIADVVADREELPLLVEEEAEFDLLEQVVGKSRQTIRSGDQLLGMLLGLLIMGAGVALAMPAMANAIMSAIPPEKAGVGAG